MARRSQRHRRYMRGIDSHPRAAYEFNEPSRVPMAQQVTLLTAKRGGAPPSPTVGPTITGTTTVGQVLTAVDGTWTGGATTTRQWYSGDRIISGAAGIASTYTLVAGDLGYRMSVVVTASNAYGKVSRRSPSRGPVA